MDEICPVCRSSRWCGRPCARAPQKPVEAPAVVTAATVAKPRAIKPSDDEKPGKQGFDRAAYHKQYMREFMRKKRAAAKA